MLAAYRQAKEFLLGKTQKVLDLSVDEGNHALAISQLENQWIVGLGDECDQLDVAEGKF